MPLVDLLITACFLSAGHPTCEDIRVRTSFASVEQCQHMGQPALAEIMQAYPKRTVVRYACEEVKAGRSA